GLNRKVCRSSPDFQQESWDVLSEGNATFKSGISLVLGTMIEREYFKATTKVHHLMVFIPHI
ncbi:MAG: hypothetical protein SPK32_10430, partial [Bacteroidaceae bacterium]|nr:hypothetical protein [Bacteroidaceae bacterium]